MAKIAINGFGRIGRNFFKIALARSDMEIVAINDLTDAPTLAYLLKYDSTYGVYDQEVRAEGDELIVDGKRYKVLAEKDPENLPWGELGVDVVVECTGLFTKTEDAKKHIAAGAKKIVISAPAKDEGARTIVLGVNEEALSAEDDIISNASCTTNCITPVMAVIEENFGIEKAMMTTVHAYTASQRLLDAPAKDLREARAAAENIVPTTTGASKAAALALPAVKGKFAGLSVRVPVPVVSLADFVILVKKDTNIEEINHAFKTAATEARFAGILSATDEPLVSSDFRGNSYSCTVDMQLTDVVGGNMIKVVSWYDNEWGYSSRLVEITEKVGAMV